MNLCHRCLTVTTITVTSVHVSDTLPLVITNIVFHSWLQSLSYCYARVIQETCNTSSADINVLKTTLYDAKLSSYRSSSCVLGEMQPI